MIILAILAQVTYSIKITPVWPPVSNKRAFSSQTNYGEWTNCAEQGERCYCAGYVRQRLSNTTYTAPVVVDISVNCNSSDIQDYLWTYINDTQGVCERRNHRTVILQSQEGCMQIGQAGGGWPGPGVLPDCAKFPGWVYHKETGQLRSKGKCVTAVKPVNATSYAPWLVALQDCSMAVAAKARQAWDFPENWLTADGAVPLVNYHQPTTVSGGLSAVLAGISGRISLRESNDIGKRCLELTEGFVEVFDSALFLEARMCDDLTLPEFNRTQWTAYFPETEIATEEWGYCSDDFCSDCLDDCELRFRAKTNSTKAVGFTGPLNDRCNLDSIRKIAIPQTGTDGNCTCQVAGPQLVAWDQLAKYTSQGAYHNAFNFTPFGSLAETYQKQLPQAVQPHELLPGAADDLPENQYFNATRKYSFWGPAK
jgi:hypothetical protein